MRVILAVEGDADLGEMLGVLGLDELLAPVAEAPAEVLDLAQRRERARAERDFARADKLREEIAESGWEVRDGPSGPELLPLDALVILYGRNPVREALRGRRARGVAQVWASASAAHEPWLADVSTKVCGADELERICGSSAHQGVCAEVGGYPYVGAHELLAVDSPLIVALDQVQDPQNLGSICRTAECAGATGVVIPERRAAEVTPAACKASAGAVEHMRIARVRNIADFLGEARDAGCWSYGASAPASALRCCRTERSSERCGWRGGARAGATGLNRRCPTPPPTTAAGWCSCSAARAAACALAWPALAISSCRCPCEDSMESLGVAAAAAALLYGILQSRDVALDKAP